MGENSLKNMISLTALTERELQIAEYVSCGYSNKRIASDLWLSVRTVEAHVSSALVKVGVNNRTKLAAWYMVQSH